MLANLSLSADPAVRAAVAAHPNTRAPVLGTLAAEFPDEVLSNPALPLLRLADPNLTRDWPLHAQLTLLRHPAAPPWLRRQALTRPGTEFQVALASHPALTAAELDALADHPAWLVRARIASRPDLSPQLLTVLTDDADYGVRLAVAARRDLPHGSVQRLLKDPSRFVQQVMRQTQRQGLAAFVLLLTFGAALPLG